MNDSSPQPPRAFIWWFLWVAFLGGTIVQYNILGKPGNTASEDAGMPWIIALVPLAISIVCRWALLPRMLHDERKALVVFILGIATAEAVNIFGLFLFPSQKLPLFCAAIFGIVQFAPYYASRFGQENPPGDS